jgi:hypothetical protein
MGQKQDARTLYTITCACGAAVSLDARGFGKPVVCRKCGGSFTVGWTKNPYSGKSSPVAVTLAKKQAGTAETPFILFCACGYRRPAGAAEAAGRNRCPGCGKMMVVEKPATPKADNGKRGIILSSPSRAPTPGPLRAVPASAMGGSDVRVIRIDFGTQTVECVCGEKILVLNQSIGQVMSCPGCSRKLQVERRESSSSTYPRVSIPPGSKTPTPPPGLFCRCGQAVDIAKAMTSKGAICSACGETITMEKVRTSNKNTIVRPRFGPKPPPPAEAPPPPPAKAPPPPAPEPELPEALELPAAQSTEPAAAPYAPRDVSHQAVFCPCGEALMVGPADVGKNIQCPTCMILIAVDQVRDMSGNSVLRVRAIGKMDDGDTWSLSDFK